MCEHCHEHNCKHHDESEDKHNHNFCCTYETNNIIRAGIAAVIVVAAIISNTNKILSLILYLTAYITAGADIVFLALKNILKGNFFDENFLMSLATTGAFCTGEYPEAVSVMILYQIGEFLQHKAVNKSRNSISKLMDIKPDYANIEENGILIQKHPQDILVNDIIIVKSGEKIPLDGRITEGHSYVDTSSLTGESVLKEVNPNDEVLSGMINTNGVLKILVTKLYKDSAVSKILELVENASSKKSKTEKFITKFAKYYTPLVVIFALLIVLIPLSLFGTDNINTWFQRALTFLVISCPCALVISIPLTFFSAIGVASKCGILIKGSNYIELLSKPDTIVFDKTGTLTKGTFKVTDIVPADNISKDELLEYAAKIEAYSNHPISVSIKEAYSKAVDTSKITNFTEITGNGVKITENGNELIAGSKKFMEINNIKVDIPIEIQQKENIVYIAKDLIYIGSLIISDELKDNAEETIKQIQKHEIKTVMLTGDSFQNAQQTASALNINEFYAGLLPVDKVKKLENLILNKNKNKSIIFAGDGINDAPVLMRADIGIAMGALGSDAAIEAADIVITDDNISKINTAVNIAKKTILIAKQNIIFAIGVKLLFLTLGVFGLMTMWGAVFADVGVTLIAVLNSLRNLKIC